MRRPPAGALTARLLSEVHRERSLRGSHLDRLKKLRVAVHKARVKERANRVALRRPVARAERRARVARAQVRVPSCAVAVLCLFGMEGGAGTCRA